MKLCVCVILLLPSLWPIVGAKLGNDFESIFGDATTSTTFAKDSKKPVGQPDIPEGQSNVRLTYYFYEADALLRDMNLLWIEALVAICFGAVNLRNGPASFKSVVVGGMSLVAAGIARSEVMLHWPNLNLIQQIVVAVEFGLVTAYVLHKSFRGTQVVIGATFGIAVSLQMDPWLHFESWPVNACLIWYSVFAFLGIVAFTYGERYVLAFVTPLVGGFLCASGLGFLIKYSTSVYIEQHQGISVPAWIEVRGTCWLDFASELLSGEHAGIFKPYPTPGFPVSSIDFDKLLGRSLWLVLFIVALKRQWRLAKETTAAQWATFRGTTGISKEKAQPLLPE